VGVAIGVPLTISFALVIVATLIQVFFGLVSLALWVPFAGSASGLAAFSLNRRRSWMRHPTSAQPRSRLFGVLTSTWLVAWLLAVLIYTGASLALYPGDSPAYALSVGGTALLAMTPFLIVYMVASGISISRIAPETRR
jgi:hypothetical protein